MKTWLVVALLAIPAVTAGSFGAGNTEFVVYTIPEGMARANDSGEPTIGIPWDTNAVFFQAFNAVHRAEFDDNQTVEGAAAVTWTDVTPVFGLTNVDPMLHADPITNRIWAGGLLGPCSSMGISDDNGETWIPSGNMCTGAQFDHQSIGSGPWSLEDPIPRGTVYDRATYYCAQLALTACTTSIDGGITWLPFTEVLGGCGGLHGHIRVSEVTGFAVVPDGSCGNNVGFGYTDNNGLTWSSRTVAGSKTASGGFDPSINFGKTSGWLYVGAADSNGVHVAMSKDQGVTWEKLGGNMTGVEATTWLDVGQFFKDPIYNSPIKFGAFADMQVGDDDRAFFAYLGSTNPDATNPFDNCGAPSDGNIWHYYLSQTFDGGGSWTTTRILEDPVQVGAIWDGGGGEPCRNLLDFNDSDIDSMGRLHIAFADGCLNACVDKYEAWKAGNGEPPKGSDSRDSYGTILRQATGRGVFSAYDQPDPIVATPTFTGGDGKATPGVGFGVALVALAALVLARRK